MTLESLQAALALPEIFIASMACLILVIGLYASKEKGDDTCFWLSVATLVATAALIVNNFATESVYAFNGLFACHEMFGAQEFPLVRTFYELNPVTGLQLHLFRLFCGVCSIRSQSDKGAYCGCACNNGTSVQSFWG